ncbi:MAG TPA: pepsin/retropepsin-like aspartic protease family protein [Chthoniobacterales bacterium]
MKKSLVIALLFEAFAAHAVNAQQSNGSLLSLVAGEGLAGAKLDRRFGNHLFVPVSFNKQRAALMIDTGAPVTLIDNNSVNTFGLKVENTTINVGGLFGRQWERYGEAVAKTIAMGNCVLTNVRVALADESSMNPDITGTTETGSHLSRIGRLPHLNGLLGVHDMHEFGMIIDCTRQMLYVNPNGPTTAVSQKVAAFLAARGFTRVPMRRTANGHLDVSAALNGHTVRLVVDTGSGVTTIDKRAAAAAGIGIVGTQFAATSAGKVQSIGNGTVKELKIGEFTLANTQVEIATVASEVAQRESAEESNAGLIGAEYLGFNFAVIDVGGMALYLRHPDSR